MFDKPLEFKFVQRNRKRFDHQDFEFEYVFKFFIDKRNDKNIRIARRKMVVEVKQYANNIFKVDFYATVSSKESKVVNQEANKYRYMTNVGKANRVASTIFAIMRELRMQFPDLSYGFQAATMLGEDSDNGNRRFSVYYLIMQAVTGAENSSWKSFGYKENSYIFVIQKRLLDNKSLILEAYGRVFGKTFEEESGSEI
jgi:hypothetical protein